MAKRMVAPCHRAAVVYSYVKIPKFLADAPISYEDAVTLATESDAWQNSGYFSDDIELFDAY